MSTRIDLGPVLSVPKGDWNADTTYERLNMVRHNSAAWICNVATSKGVEPTESSTDWYLQVKDTSAVTSVNGMKGDVVITLTETETPPANDNSNRIATTGWVTDKLGDVDLSGIKDDTIEAALNASNLEVGTGDLTSAEIALELENLRTLTNNAQDSADTANEGLVGVVRSVNGTVADMDGNITLNISAPVTSVNGQTGDVTVASGMSNRQVFTSSGTFTTPKAGVYTFMLVGGGTAGKDGDSDNPGSGGSGGKYYEGTLYIPASTSCSITVGSGGASGGASGGNSSITVGSTYYHSGYGVDMSSGGAKGKSGAKGFGGNGGSAGSTSGGGGGGGGLIINDLTSPTASNGAGSKSPGKGGTGYGAGGGGGQVGYNGGKGASGIVIIYY